jgi:hypothetical protein
MKGDNMKSESLRDLLVITSSFGILLILILPDGEIKLFVSEALPLVSLIIMLLAYVVLGREIKKLSEDKK